MTREPVDSTAELPILESADALEAVPGFTLIRMLAETTLARVYECRHERTGEIVVVKVLAKDFVTDRAAVQRVLRENRVIAGLRSHPNIARVVDVGESAAGPYVAFEKIAGTDLRTRLNQGSRIPVAEALAAVRDAAKAIEAAAAVGVAHRDVKPSNLFVLAAGGTKLTDFGFAAPLARLGGPAGVYGTPSFIAPELIKGAPADVRTDIYALGATLFQLVTARPLFEGATPDVLSAHQKKPVPSIATMVPDAGIAVVDILYRLLHKDPARRPQSPAEVVKLLDDAIARARRTSTADNLPAASEPQWPTMQPTVPMPRPSVGGAVAQPKREERAPERPPPSPFDAPASDSGDAYAAQRTSVQATVKQMSVSEIVQMLEIGKKSARVEVSDMQNTKGVLHVHDGQLVHATFGKDVGEPAVVAMCVRKEGYFRIHYDKEQCERNITRPTTFVLLEAMRQIDEIASQPPAPAATPARAAPPRTSSQAAVPKPSPRLPTPLARPLPSLAKPIPAPGAQEGFADSPVTLPEAAVPAPKAAGSPDPVAGIGDGIQFESSGNLQAVGSVDDVTLRETPTAIGKSPLDRALSEARALWLRTEPALVRAWGEAKRVSVAAWKTAQAKSEPLRPQLGRVHPKLAQVSPLAVAAGALAIVILLVVVVASVARTPKATLGYDDALRMILRGKSNAVVGALGNVAPGARTPWQTLALADASAVLQDDDRAIPLYSAALPQGAVDPLELGYLAARLDASAPDDEMDLLVLWPDRDVDDLLQPLTLDVRSFVRQNSVAVLVERGALSRINVEQVAILDLLPREGTCASRTTAMRALAAAGRSKGALDVVDRVGHAQDSCFQSGELSAAYKAIKKRL